MSGLFHASRNNDYGLGNLLDYMCQQIYFEIMGIDLSRQTNKNIPDQGNFTERLEENDGTTTFFIAEK